MSEGVLLPEILIRKEFKSENQIKTIQYLQLDELYQKTEINDEEIKKTYESNKKIFSQEFKKINYTELLPNSLTGQKEYNEAYFKKIDEIENAILDGGKMADFIKKFSLSIITINETNQLKKDKTGKEIIKIDDSLFAKIFSFSNINKPELININNKYYLGEVSKIEMTNKTLKNKQVKEAITSQLKIKYIIENNSNIAKEISEGKFKKEQFNEFSKKNNIEIKEIKLKNIKDESVFNSAIIKEIFKVKDDELQMITNSMLTKNYIIFSKKTEEVSFNKKIKDYERYKSKAKLSLANQIYSNFDKAINNKYNVVVNQKVLKRIKNTL